MKAPEIRGKEIICDKFCFEAPYKVRDAFVFDSKVIVLLDPNDYLEDPAYSKERRRGQNSIRNLFALSSSGIPLWEAQYPEEIDYYYEIISQFPLIANSFSSYECMISLDTGKILRQEFHK
jgi:hypothetical protein